MRTLKWIIITVVGLLLLAYASLWLYFTIIPEPNEISNDDPRLPPLLEAIENASAQRSAFVPIPKKPRTIYLEEATSDNGLKCDVKLSYYYGRNGTGKHIRFEKTDEGYIWIKEQDMIDGPDKWKDSQGSKHTELILIDYGVYKENELTIVYSGRDPRFKNHPFQQDEAVALIKEWETK